jgi:hypothetical protein
MHHKIIYIYIYICVCVSNLMSLIVVILFNTSVYVSGVPCPSSGDIYCLVSHYGTRKCALWCPVVWSPDDGQGMPETCTDELHKITTICDIKLDTYIYCKCDVTCIINFNFKYSNRDFNIRHRQSVSLTSKCSDQCLFECLRKAWRWLQYELKHVADVVCCQQYLTCCVWQYTPTKL